MVVDRFGYPIHYLRISLTDHCNLHCIYCIPENPTFCPNPELIQDEEAISFVRLFASLGFDKIRLMGGEPTVRVNLADLVRHSQNYASKSWVASGSSPGGMGLWKG